jgi:hypothetical protein
MFGAGPAIAAGQLWPERAFRPDPYAACQSVLAPVGVN